MADRHKSRTKEDNSLRVREQLAKRLTITDADLVPTDENGLPYSRQKLAWFKRRRESCRKSLLKFATTYCMENGGFLETEPSGRLVDILAQMQRAVVSGDWDGEGNYRALSPVNFHCRIARGHGKTSFVKCAIAYALCYGFRRYVVAVSDGVSGASGLIDEIWGLFEESETLYQDFPELCVPIRLAEGNSNRAKEVKYNGRRTKMRKSSKEIKLPEMRGFADTGAILVARSFGAGARGLVRNKLRPDLILFDDIQDDEMADSAEQIRKAVEKIDGTFMGLAGHRKRIAALMTSTPIKPYDLSETFVGKSGWKTFTYPMLVYPSCWGADGDPWKDYFHLLDQDTVDGGTRAVEFYRANRARMDEGASVLNPNNYDHDCEFSAIQHAMNLRAANEETFDAEYQMKPRRDVGIYDLAKETVLSRVNGVRNFVVPTETTDVVATIDVMNQAGLRWTIQAFGQNRVSAVVAYGQYPANGRPLYLKTDNEDVQDSKIDAALQVLVNDFAANPLTTEDGGSVRICAVGIDAGWRMRTVQTFCKRNAHKFQRLEPMKGVSWKDFSPYSSSGRLKGNIRLADEWAFVGRSKFGKYIGFHADHFLETAQRAWFCSPLQPGSLSLFGTDPSVHSRFADEMVADRLADKDKTRRGEDTWKWSTNGANHFGDCVKMAYALAYWHKIFDDGASKKKPSLTAKRVAPLAAKREESVAETVVAPAPKAVSLRSRVVRTVGF